MFLPNVIIGLHYVQAVVASVFTQPWPPDQARQVIDQTRRAKRGDSTLLPPKSGDRLPGLQIPNLDNAIPRSRRQVLPIGAECQAEAAVGVGFQSSDALACCEIEEHHFTFGVARRQSFAVRRDRCALDRCVVSDQVPKELAARGIPKPQSSIPTPSNKTLPVGRKRDGLGDLCPSRVALARLQHVQFFASS